mmetsp:Transcript_8320/g.13995  ORF Transcript_8320/g.13995 Transcript_8320/m.13995 type:complete len:192 (+) Transcript_8320:21-596(+)
MELRKRLPPTTYSRKYARELHEKMVALRTERVALIKYAEHCNRIAALLLPSAKSENLKIVGEKDEAEEGTLPSTDPLPRRKTQMMQQSINWSTGKIVSEDGSSKSLETESLLTTKHARAVFQARKTRERRNKIMSELEMTLERIETENQRVKKVIMGIIITLKKKKKESYRLDANLDSTCTSGLGATITVK